MTALDRVLPTMGASYEPDKCTGSHHVIGSHTRPETLYSRCLWCHDLAPHGLGPIHACSATSSAPKVRVCLGPVDSVEAICEHSI